MTPRGALNLTGAVLVMAGLDLAGSVAAKEWTLRRERAWFLAGLACFLVLFAVYAHSLRLAELSLVTIAWVVVLQVGLLVVDRVRYGVTLPLGHWLAIAAILALQGYLILAPTTGEDVT